MFVIGLTGGLASGKSTAARHLVARGAQLLDADKLGHESYAPGGPAYDAVLAAFGREVLGADGRINRAALGARVFGKPKERARLEAIVWPAIAALAREKLAAIARATPDAVVVLEAAVLVEAGWQNLVDEVWLVSAPRAEATRRAMARDGRSQREVEQRLDAQTDDATRRAHADRCFENNGDEAALFAQLDIARREARLQGGKPALQASISPTAQSRGE